MADIASPAAQMIRFHLLEGSLNVGVRKIFTEKVPVHGIISGKLILEFCQVNRLANAFQIQTGYDSRVNLILHAVQQLSTERC